MRRLEEFLNTQHTLKEGTKETYRVALRSFDRLGSEFEDDYLDNAKVHEVLNGLSTILEDSTWNTRLICFKRYARWLGDPEDEETPRLWKKIKKKTVDVEQKLKHKWLSEQEFLDLVNATFNPMYRAMWAVAWSGGLRPGEYLGLHVESRNGITNPSPK